MGKKIETAIKYMENIAKNDSHGYDQIHRWGEKGDYDCSSLVTESWNKAGVPVKSNGATYTGNMYNAFIKSGFKDVTNTINLKTGAGLKRGDVLLNIKHHTAMYCGDGKEVEASINEKGTATGGKPGDQTGKEILIRPYRNYPWDKVLRYMEDEWVNNGWGWWYRYSDGSYPKNKWLKIDGYWFYFNGKGYAVTGWQFINGQWYYFDDNCYMQTGWIKDNDKWYYLSKSGAMVKNKYIPSTTTEHLYYWVNNSGEWTSSSYDVNAFGVFKE